MAQRTDVESQPGTETHSAPDSPVHSADHAAAEPPRRSANFFREHPQAKKYLAVLIIILIIAGFFAWRYFSSYVSTDDAEIDGHLIPVSARISGYVSKVNVNDNQYVEAGAVLVEIDPRDYQVALDQARASLEDARAAAQAMNINVPVTTVSTKSEVSVAEANVENAQAGITAAEQQSEAAQAELDQAQANNTKSQNDLARYKELVGKQEISQQMYDQATATAAASTAAVSAAKASAAAAAQQVAQARSRLAQAEANLLSAQTGPQQVRSTRARALGADATVQQKEAAVEQADLNLQYTKIVAPAAGVVTKSVEVGMNVQPGQQLLSIVPLNEVWVTANFKETQLRDMKPGQRVRISVDANDRTYWGRVDSIAGSSGARLSLLPPENATGNYVKVVQRVPVKIVLDPGQNKDLNLRLGMSVEPKVYLK